MEHARTWGQATQSQIMDTGGEEDFQAKDEAISQKKITMEEKKTSKSREREADPDSRGTRNTKQTRLEKGLPVSNYTLRMYNKGSTRKATKEKDSSSRRERQDHQNNCWLFNQNLTCTEGSVWGISKSKRSQLPTQLTVTCRTISGNWRW